MLTRIRTGVLALPIFAPTQVRLTKVQEEDVSIRVYERGVNTYSITRDRAWRNDHPRDEEWEVERDSSQLDFEYDAYDA